MQEGTEAVQRAIGKPSGRVRRRETLHQHAHIGMKKSSTQSRERVKGQCPLRSPEAEPLAGLVKTNSHKEAPKMAITIALAGNPNCGKTTMFNALTGSRQFVGNWPGVTVEKKEGKLKGNDDVVIQDLPGIYSLSPYTLEEVVARNYLVNDKPDAILNIVDSTSIERNLYLTTQLLELGTPMVIAMNMIDVSRKNGDKIDMKKLSAALGVEIVETSALKGEGSVKAAEKAAAAAKNRTMGEHPHVFTGSVEHALAHIEDLIGGKVEPRFLRWYAVKLFERDEKVVAELKLSEDVKKGIEEAVSSCEKEMDDDAESIITNQRYAYINTLMQNAVKKGKAKGSLSVSDKIDRVVTNRVLALPIFALIMFLVYYISVTTIGSLLTDWTNDVFVAEIVQGNLQTWLDGVGCAGWLSGLIVDGIVGGCGAVLGFVPQMLVLFLLLAILEDVGYMARIAFIMDRIFRKFGLSGKSFIPMLIGSGCGVPGIMASRTIESDRDRKMTIMTTTFIPCGAKMPIIGLIAAAVFGGSAWVATSAYFIGVAAIVISGIMLKKTKMFAGDPAPFVMELPAYHFPSGRNVFHSVWERGWSFIKRAGTVILLSSIVIWFAKTYGWAPAADVQLEAQQTYQTELADYNAKAEAGTLEEDEEAPELAPEMDRAAGSWGAVADMDNSILGKIGNPVSVVFKPLGFGNMPSTVATVMGLVAKEEVVGVLGVLYGADDAADVVDDEDMTEEEKAEALSPIATAFNESSNGHGRLAAYAFMIFNLLCAPCFAAIGAMKREFNNAKWTLAAVGYQCAFAYTIALIVYQLGLLFSGAGFTVATAIAILLLAGLVYLVVRKNPYNDNHLTQKVSA